MKKKEIKESKFRSMMIGGLQIIYDKSLHFAVLRNEKKEKGLEDYFLYVSKKKHPKGEIIARKREAAERKALRAKNKEK